MKTGIPIGILVCCTVLPAPAQMQTTAEWLVDLGRGYPLSQQAGVADVDAELTLLILEAAARVDPNLPEAHRWQADLLAALGRDQAATAALERYLALRPGDEWVWLSWVDARLAAPQTAEARAELCRTLLKTPGLPKVASSRLHEDLAGFHLNRGDRNGAGDEANAALRDDPFNLPAMHLSLETVPGERMDHQAMLRLLLASLRTRPADAGLAWQTADAVADAGMTREAETFYAHAVALYEKFSPGGTPPMLHVARGWALLETREPVRAREQAEAALKRGDSVDAHLLLAEIAERGGDQPAHDNQLRLAAAANRSQLRPGSAATPDDRAGAAWHDAVLGGQPKQAMTLARQALQEAPESAAAITAMGAALLASGDAEGAVKQVAPLAGHDPRAALVRAHALNKLDRHGEAEDALREALNLGSPGPVHAMAMSLAREWSLSVPTTRPADEAREAVRSFPREVLAYPLTPERFLKATLSVPPELPPGRPWVCTLRLTNTGPIPILFGADRMVAPEVLLAVESRGDAVRGSGPTLPMILHDATVLPPGGTWEAQRTLNIGTMHAAMIATPQQTHHVTVSGLLAPALYLTPEGNEQYAPAPGGLLIEPLTFRRTGLLATQDKVAAILRQAQAPDIAVRTGAVELLAMLIAERQHLDAGRLGYSVPRVDAQALLATLLQRTGDDAWEIRARLAECLRWFTLEAGGRAAAATLLRDPHWLVRGLTLRAIVDHDGEKFRPVLEQFARAEPDPWVRRLASALIQRLDLAASVASQPSPRETP